MSRPEEIFAQIDAWLSELPDLAAECEAFRLLAERDASDVFRVVIAGGISRGKTRLLNSLLAAQIFPEGSIPTTAVLTEVSYGKQPEAEFESRAGKIALEPVSAALAQYSADDSDDSVEGILRVKWPAPFLEQGLVIYDTPGIDDTLRQQADLAFSALDEAEGAIVVVSASTPVSLIEKDFIQTYLENRALPHIAVAIAFLDTIPAPELERQIRFIQNRVRRIDPAIEVWLTDAAFTGADVCGASAIRDRLLAWARDPARQELRDKRDLQTCSALLTGCIGKLEQRLEALESERAGRSSKYRQASEDLEMQQDVWHRIRRDFLARSKQLTQEAMTEIGNLQSDLTEAMRSLPEDDFRRELRQRLAASARSLSDLLRERLAGDTEKLRQAVGQNFGPADLPGLASTRSFAIGYALPELPEKNPGDLLVMLIGYARGVWKNIGPMLPLPIVIRGGAQKLVDHALAALAAITSSRPDASREIEQQIDAFFDGLRGQLGDSITALYEEKAEHLREEQERWVASQRELIAALRTPEQLEARISTTASEIYRGRKLLAAVRAASQCGASEQP